jgi:hypothetical protein
VFVSWSKAKKRETRNGIDSSTDPKTLHILVGSGQSVTDSGVPQRDTELRGCEIREGHLARGTRRAYLLLAGTESGEVPAATSELAGGAATD